MKGMEQAFSCLYFLTKQRIAHKTNYEPLLDLVCYLGIDIKGRISKARNASYTSEKIIQEMVFIMSEVLENKILEDMRESDNFSSFFDEKPIVQWRNKLQCIDVTLAILGN